jgi:hypothetical protein
MLTLLLAAALAAPPKCDAKGLQKKLTEASPASVPAAYVDLAACNPDAAKAASADSFRRTLAGDAANKAVKTALALGVSQIVRDWITQLPADERAATLAWLGHECPTDAQIEAFLVESSEALGNRFVTDRWFRSLVDCRTPKIQAVLGKQVEAAAIAKRNQIEGGQFLAIMQVYAKNLGVASLPTLSALTIALKDEIELAYVAQAFREAAVSPDGTTKPEDAAKVVEELGRCGERLPPKAIDEARRVMTDLGHADETEPLAKYKWPDRRTGNGYYRYAVVAVERVTCGNGKRKEVFHQGPFTEPGDHWPESIEPTLPERLRAEWQLEALAEKCKGTAEVQWEMPAEPFANDDERTKWINQQRGAYVQALPEKVKPKEVAHDAFKIDPVAAPAPAPEPE